MTNRYIKDILLPLSLLFALASCGGGGGSDDSASNIFSGVFLDSAVEGLTYKTETISGLTDSTGKFTYRDGESVSFYIGDLYIGTALPKDILTPLDFLAFPSFDAPELLNTLSLLQTLDKDNDASNGIQLPTIPEGLGEELNITNQQDIESFLAAVDSGATLIDSTTSLNHFVDTIGSLPTVEAENIQDTYIFSAAHQILKTSNTVSNIYTNLNASFQWLDSKSIDFSVTLPSGYTVSYNGSLKNTGIRTLMPNHSDIDWYDLGSSPGFGVVDPTSNYRYSVRFINTEVENIAPRSIGSSQTTLQSLYATTYTYTINVNKKPAYCIDFDDHIVSEKYTVFFDGGTYPIQTIANGLQTSQSESFDYAFYEPSNGITPYHGSLIEQKSIKWQIECTDSRGETYQSPIRELFPTKQGEANNQSSGILPPGTYYDQFDPNDIEYTVILSDGLTFKYYWYYNGTCEYDGTEVLTQNNDGTYTSTFTYSGFSESTIITQSLLDAGISYFQNLPQGTLPSSCL